MSYQIKIQSFEGPFDLLFHLIEKAEVDIYDIPIAEITNQYLEYISEMKSLDLEVASEFVVMAATLIQIKSRMLLPQEPSSLNEIAVDGEDIRTELVEKLLEYKKYKEVSKILKENEEKYINVVYKPGEIIDDIDEDKILLNITLGDLLGALRDVLKRNEAKYNVDNYLDQQIIREEFTVDDKMDIIRNYIRKNKVVRFKELFSINSYKYEIILTFLGILELMRLREINVFQDTTYGDIIIQGI